MGSVWVSESNLIFVHYNVPLLLARVSRVCPPSFWTYMHAVYGYLATTETRHHNFIKFLQRSRHKNEQLLMANWLEAKRSGGEVTSSLRNELRTADSLLCTLL